MSKAKDFWKENRPLVIIFSMIVFFLIVVLIMVAVIARANKAKDQAAAAIPVPATVSMPTARPAPKPTAKVEPTLKPTVIPTARPTPEPTVVFFPTVVVSSTEPSTPTLSDCALKRPVQLENEMMLNYQKTLAYTVGADLAVPDGLLCGFWPVESLVFTETNLPAPDCYEVRLPAIPEDLSPYRFFPQDDPENPDPVWEVPIASYREGDNWFCDDVSGWCADAVDSFNWMVWTGETVCHPAVGCLRDPDGGAVMLLLVNFHDSDEAWDVRTGTGLYVTAGWAGFGKMFDLSGESYDIGMGIAAIRNHYFYNLAFNHDYDGACGDSELCATVTYVVVNRLWNRPELGINYSHYELVDWGQFSR